MSTSQVLRDNLLGGRAKYSVRVKLMWVVLMTTLTALLIAGAAMMVYELRNHRETRVNDLFAQADLIGRATLTALVFDDRKEAQKNLSLLRAAPDISAAALYTIKGEVFAFYTQQNSEGIKFPEFPEAEGYKIDGDKLSLFKQIRDNDGVVGTIFLQTHYEIFDRLKSYLSILAGVMVLSLLVALLITAWLQNSFSKPILEITEVARQVITKRDFSLRVRKTTEDEIGYLVDAFNGMLAEIGQQNNALEESNRALQVEMDERREAEKALIAADQRKDEFLATLAHELRNPLAPLRNALEILRTADGNAATLQSARDMMERQLRQLVRLVNDLLDVSRITTGKMILKMERIEFQEVVKSAVEAAEPLIKARQHRLTLRIPPEPVVLYADFTRLSQVLLNLLNNAAKFTEVGGQITLTAELKISELIITVTDTGIGISAKMLPKIFDMFVQADRSLERPQAGLGVGLALVKYLVELHGGNIVAVSEGAGKGSQLIVRLPTHTHTGQN